MVAASVGLEVCVACGAACERLKKCGSCKEKLYCSRECQVGHYKAHRAYCRETVRIRKHEAAELFNAAATLHDQGNRLALDRSAPDRVAGHAKWHAAISKYQRCLEVAPDHGAAREALVGLLEWQEDATRRHVAMCEELVYELADFAATFADHLCRSIVLDVARVATCRSRHTVFTSWLFKESRTRGIGGASSFRRFHASIEKKLLVFFKDETHDVRKDWLNLEDVVRVCTDFPLLDALAFPPAYCRIELHTRTKSWLLAVPPEEIAKKREWLCHVADTAGLALRRPSPAPPPPPDDDDDPEAGE